MFAILKKEINAFFASPIGYLVVTVFLLLNGLFLWLFKGEFNILDNGFAELTPFFTLAPWILLFLIPAVTMRSFSDEKKQGTLELLLTKPIKKINIVLGKYFGAFLLILIALLPTLLYVYSVNQLGNPVGNLDLGSTLGSYFGLLFLIGAYTAIGIFTSTLSNNQIVAFIVSVFLCFFFYYGFNGIADLLSSESVSQLGMDAHFKSMSRGVIDTRDVLYFLSLALIFVFLTVVQLKEIKTFRKTWLHFLPLPLGLIILNLVAQSYYGRFDLTSDKRYTLSEVTKEIVSKAESPIIIDVFLDGDDFPSEIRKLQTETRQLLEEFAAQNKHINFQFLDPLKDETTKDQNIQSLTRRGLMPMQLSVKESGKTSTKVIFPWDLASFNEQTVIIPLIKNKLGEGQDEMVNNSVQHLEYAFADGISKLVNNKQRKVAILRGNGELDNAHLADFLKTIRDYYYIAPFTLDSVAVNPQKTLTELTDFDLVIAAKPTKPFSEEEKYVLDQYVMNGGKSLWLMDEVAIDMDSLNANGKSYAIPLDLNLTDFFFKYGVRINPVLVNDLYSARITLATGEGSQAQFSDYPWFYSPLVTSDNQHPIVNNINLVKFDFANQIDTLNQSNNSVKKTVLLHSSILSKVDGTPREIDLAMVMQEPDPKEYTNGYIPLAVLLEGQFTSVYKNRVKPLSLKPTKDESVPTKMIVISDGDVIKNEVGRNGPEELGFNKRTGQLYGNKEFLLNAVNYLLDDNGLINIRSKQIQIAFLDHEKVAAEKTKWQLLNILLPLGLLGLFGLAFNFIRRRRYAA